MKRKRVITICLISGLNEQLEDTLLRFRTELFARATLEEAWRVMSREHPLPAAPVHAV